MIPSLTPRRSEIECGKKKNKALTGRRENGGRRGLREREGEVHRREPDLGAALVLPIAARICIKRHANHATEMAGERSPDSAPNRVEPSTGRKEGRPTSFPGHPSGREGVREGRSAECCARRGCWSSGREAIERREIEGVRCEVRKKSGRLLSA